MAPFSDRQLEQLFIQYNDRERDRVFIYHGSQDVIIKELKAWVLRRKKIFAEQKGLINISERRIEGMLSSEVKAPEPGHLDSVLRRRARRLDLDEEATQDSARAAYLLDTLKCRGITWPKLWWRPDVDGGVCSFLGTVDAAFDPDATLTELEAGADEERIWADWAEIDPHVPAKWAAVEAKFGGNLGDEDKREIAYATGGECSDGADTHRGVGNRAAR